MAAFSHSSVLFTHEDGEPLKYYMRPCKSRITIRQLIEHGGGICTSSNVPGAIRLAEDGSLVCSDDVYCSSYIEDCVHANELLDSEPYRCTVGDKADSHRPSKHRLPDDDVDFDIETGMSSVNITTVHVDAKDRKGRRQYLLSEDMNIIRYLLDNSFSATTGGNVMWKDMEMKKITFHTWQSMKDRYRKFILPNITQYSIPIAEMSRLDPTIRITKGEMNLNSNDGATTPSKSPLKNTTLSKAENHYQSPKRVTFQRESGIHDEGKSSPAASHHSPKKYVSMLIGENGNNSHSPRSHYLYKSNTSNSEIEMSDSNDTTEDLSSKRLRKHGLHAEKFNPPETVVAVSLESDNSPQTKRKKGVLSFFQKKTQDGLLNKKQNETIDDRDIQSVSQDANMAVLDGMDKALFNIAEVEEIPYSGSSGSEVKKEMLQNYSTVNSPKRRFNFRRREVSDENTSKNYKLSPLNKNQCITTSDKSCSPKKQISSIDEEDDALVDTQRLKSPKTSNTSTKRKMRNEDKVSESTPNSLKKRNMPMKDNTVRMLRNRKAYGVFANEDIVNEISDDDESGVSSAEECKSRSLSHSLKKLNSEVKVVMKQLRDDNIHTGAKKGGRKHNTRNSNTYESSDNESDASSVLHARQLRNRLVMPVIESSESTTEGDVSSRVENSFIPVENAKNNYALRDRNKASKQFKKLRSARLRKQSKEKEENQLVPLHNSPSKARRDVYEFRGSESDSSSGTVEEEREFLVECAELIETLSTKYALDTRDFMEYLADFNGSLADTARHIKGLKKKAM